MFRPCHRILEERWYGQMKRGSRAIAPDPLLSCYQNFGQDYLAAPILNTLVPQVEHVPEVAGLPFFMVMAVGFKISFFALHLTQYASIVLIPLSWFGLD